MSMVLLLAASTQILACPETIIDKQSVTPQSGWEVRTDAYPRPLDNVLIFSGHPKKRASMMGIRSKNRQINWTFTDPDVWVECRYSHSSAVLTRRIEGANACTFTPREADEPGSMKCDRKK